jgi:hypothetical protein
MTDLCKMLGIELKGDPADIYRVCGLTPLETDVQLIRHAIDQTRKKLEPHEQGTFAADCAKIRTYLDQSESILTDPKRKLASEDAIRQTLEREAVAKKGVPAENTVGERPSRRHSAESAMLWGRRAKALLAAVLLIATVILGSRQFGGPERFPRSRVKGARVTIRPQALAHMKPPTKASIPDLPLGIPQPVPGFEGVTPIYTPSLSPDLKTIVFSTRSRTSRSFDLAIADREDVRKPFSKIRPVAGSTSPVDETCPAFSPDLKELVFVRVDPERRPATKLFYTRRDATDQDFSKSEPIPIASFDQKKVRLDTPQWLDRGRGLLYMVVDLEAGPAPSRPYFVSKRPARTETVGEAKRFPFSVVWPFTFLSANGIRAYHVTNKGIMLSTRESPSAPFAPPLADPVLSEEKLGPLDGPVWVTPNEDVLFYCSPGVGKKIGEGRFLWMVRFR